MSASAAVTASTAGPTRRGRRGARGSAGSSTIRISTSSNRFGSMPGIVPPLVRFRTFVGQNGSSSSMRRSVPGGRNSSSSPGSKRHSPAEYQKAIAIWPRASCSGRRSANAAQASVKRATSDGRGRSPGRSRATSRRPLRSLAMSRAVRRVGDDACSVVVPCAGEPMAVPVCDRPTPATTPGVRRRELLARTGEVATAVAASVPRRPAGAGLARRRARPIDRSPPRWPPRRPRRRQAENIRACERSYTALPAPAPGRRSPRPIRAPSPPSRRSRHTRRPTSNAMGVDPSRPVPAQAVAPPRRSRHPRSARSDRRRCSRAAIHRVRTRLPCIQSS